MTLTRMNLLPSAGDARMITSSGPHAQRPVATASSEPAESPASDPFDSRGILVERAALDGHDEAYVNDLLADIAVAAPGMADTTYAMIASTALAEGVSGDQAGSTFLAMHDALSQAAGANDPYLATVGAQMGAITLTESVLATDTPIQNAVQGVLTIGATLDQSFGGAQIADLASMSLLEGLDTRVVTDTANDLGARSPGFHEYSWMSDAVLRVAQGELTVEHAASVHNELTQALDKEGVSTRMSEVNVLVALTSGYTAADMLAVRSAADATLDSLFPGAERDGVQAPSVDIVLTEIMAANHGVLPPVDKVVDQLGSLVRIDHPNGSSTVAQRQELPDTVATP